jgi:hypothetical protein
VRFPILILLLVLLVDVIVVMFLACTGVYIEENKILKTSEHVNIWSELISFFL